MLWYCLGILLFLAGCYESNTSYRQTTRMALQEAIQYGEETPVKIIALQEKELKSLKEENKSLHLQLRQAISAQEEAQFHFKQTHNQLEEIRQKHEKALQELDNYKSNARRQEENIQKLALEKIKLEQQLLHLKIQEIQKNNKEEE